MTYITGVYRPQGGNELNIASGSLVLPPNLKRGYVPLDPFGARILSSAEAFFGFQVSATGQVTPTSAAGLIHAGSVPALAMNSTVNQAAYVNWASGQQQAIAFPPVPIPPDFNGATGLSIHAIAERTTDAASNDVIDMRFWSNQNATEMGTTGATISSTPGEISVSVGATGVASHPGVWNVQFVPGVHGQNAVRVYGAWIEYDRRSS